MAMRAEEARAQTLGPISLRPMRQHIPPAHFQQIFQALPGNFLILLPDASFTIIAASDDYLRDTLRQREEVVGMPVFEIFPDNPDAPQALATHNLSLSLQRVVNTRRPDMMAVQRYDVRGLAGDGFEVRYWSPVNAPVLTADGEVLYIIHRVDNVTDYVGLTEDHAEQRNVSARLSADRVSMEAEIVTRSRELDRAKRELERVNDQLSAYAAQARDAAARKDEFLAMLAHELRNPLSAMSSALQLWAMSSVDERRQEGLLGICERQIKNLTRLVDDLLEMARIDRGVVVLHRTRLDLRDVVQHSVHAAREMFQRRRLGISTTIAPAEYCIDGDATRLEQALTNILTNAAKYSEPGGNVELKLACHASRPGTATLHVKDEGRGIPAEKLEAIFEMFAQVDAGVDRSRGGLGIGLGLVRSIIDMHGGTVRAHSEGIGHGSCFVIELPLALRRASERPTGDDSAGVEMGQAEASAVMMSKGDV